MASGNPDVSLAMQANPHARHMHAQYEDAGQSISMHSPGYALPVYGEELGHLQTATWTHGHVASGFSPPHGHAFPQGAFSFWDDPGAQAAAHVHVNDRIAQAAVPTTATGSVIPRALNPLRLNDDDVVVRSPRSVSADEYWSQTYPQVGHYPPPSSSTSTQTTLAANAGLNDPGVYPNPNPHTHTHPAHNWGEHHTSSRTPYAVASTRHSAQAWQSRDAAAVWFNTPNGFEYVDSSLLSQPS